MRSVLLISRQVRALSVQLVPISRGQSPVLVLGAAGCHHAHGITCPYQPFILWAPGASPELGQEKGGAAG